MRKIAVAVLAVPVLVLIYAPVVLQRSVLDSFSFALRDGGYLVVGKSEMMISRGSRFQAVDLKRRVFVSPGGSPDYTGRTTMSPDRP